MSEELTVPSGTKEEVYRGLLPQIESLVAETDDLIANLANIAAALKQVFNFHWVGFYRTTKPGLLMLGPFQGPLACVSIPFEKGVCGYAARTQETVVVPDVDAFPGHIACSSLSKSEIVVPLVSANETLLVLDVDSIDLNAFDSVDRVWLERIVSIIAKRHFPA
jgi:L-methionine (R)-S-oxide reductase